MLIQKIVRSIALFAIISITYLGAQSQPVGIVVKNDTIRTDFFLEDLLKQYPQYFDTLLAKRAEYNVQFIYTKIDRGANGIAGLKQFYFNVNPKKYSCPASAVKLPVAILTLQKLEELKQYGIDKNTTMLTEKSYSGQTAVYNEPTAPSGKPTIAQYLKKLLMANDEDAYNRLYEFLGQQFINEQLHKKKYTDAQLTERLGDELSEDENRHANSIKFLAPGNKLLYQQPAQYSNFSFEKRNDTLGNQDFSKKNKLALEDVNNILISLIFPNKVTSSQRFNLTDDNRKFILKYMSQLPTESFNPPYSDDTVTYNPAYSKYLFNDTLLKSIRIFNTSGQAHGQIIDAAYIVDFDKKIEFFLSAIIYCKRDDECELIGFPFMKNLGKVMYDYETKREKRIEPDLSEMKFEYDGR
jgi:hypothetical protein